MKVAFVGLIGRPSSGKSTLLNRLCGYKVSIISPVPQTTRNRIRGILNTDAGQLIFIDTPGFHLSEKKFNLHLTDLVLRTLNEVDLLLYLVDVSRPFGEEERALARLLADSEPAEIILALNKTDIESNHSVSLRRELREVLADTRMMEISARTGRGVTQLIDTLFTLAPEGQRLYPEDLYTDQTPEFRIAEILREKAILRTRDEVPHALYVEIHDMEMVSEDRLWVRAVLYTERESQKGILVGKAGARIKGIVREAEAELNTLFPYTVELDIRVKVKPKWRRNNHLLNKLIT